MKWTISIVFIMAFTDFPTYDAHSDSVSCQDSSSSGFLCDYLYKASFSAAKLLSDRKLKEGI